MKILVVKTTSMGDVVHTLPAVTDMAQAMPGVAIDWLVEAPFAAIARMHPAVRHVIPLSWRKWRRSLWRSATRQALAACRADLQRESYDLVLDFQGLLKSVFWAKQAHGPVCGYDRHSIREPLASWFYDRRVRVHQEAHAVDRCRRLASLHCGYALPKGAPDFGLQPPTSGWRPSVPHYAVLIPCASRPEKLWPAAGWAAVMAACSARGLMPVLLWGAAAEQAMAQSLAQGREALVPPFLSVGDAAGLLAGARLVVGLDTGFTHLAAALARPTVGIYCDHEPGLAGVTGPHYVSSLGGKGLVPTVDAVMHSVEAAWAAGATGLGNTQSSSRRRGG